MKIKKFCVFVSSLVVICYHFVKPTSFSDAEILKDVAKDFVGADLTGDGAKVV